MISHKSLGDPVKLQILIQWACMFNKSAGDAEAVGSAVAQLKNYFKIYFFPSFVTVSLHQCVEWSILEAY